GAHVELFQPRGVAAVLERPDERDVHDADEALAVARDEDAAAAGLGDHARDRVLDGGSRRVDGVLGGLGAEELDDPRGGAGGGGGSDGHPEILPFARARRSSLAAASADPRSGTSGRSAGTARASAASSARRSGASASAAASRVGRSASGAKAARTALASTRRGARTGSPAASPPETSSAPSPGDARPSASQASAPRGPV